MDAQINSIPICSKTQHRKDSLRLTLLKYKFLKLISTLEIILLMRWTVSKTLERKLEVLNWIAI
jgi:hypothetical protein